MTFRTTSVSLFAVAIALNASAALAQDEQPQTVEAAADETMAAADQAYAAGSDAIVVTARKRDESEMDIPVTMTTIGGDALRLRGEFSLDAVSTLAPSVIIADAGGVPQGGIVNIRGFSGPENIILTDQTVSFNIDGVQVSRSTVRRMAQMDLETIEVLRGPQALFYGKNSPAGVISIRTADPTPDVEGRLSLGYEFNAREVVSDGYISGPITDTLGGRLAFYGGLMEGWARDTTPAGTYAPVDRRSPERREWGMRGTLLWEPTDSFDARLKLNYSELDTNGLTQNVQRVDCPSPAGPFGGGPDDCTADDRFTSGTLGPVVGTLVPGYRDGIPYFGQDQFLGGLEMNYRPADQLTLTSQTGYYTVELAGTGSLSHTPTNPAASFVTYNTIDIEEFSQELRLTSDFRDSWINFMVGGFYQASTANNLQQPFLNVINPVPIANAFLEYQGDAWSAFGQLLLKPVEQLEIGLGGRYSHETKKVTEARTGLALTPVTLDPTKESWSNFSPEVTITYQPTRDLTLYASYRQGFLSGGFNTGAVTANGANALYDQQTIEGFEGGVKASLLNGSLRTNLSVYDYEVDGLLVSRVLPSGITIAQNAGKVGLTGVEADFSYRTPIDGLRLHGAAAYNDARYLDFTTPCWRGQTIAQGCNLAPNPATGAFTLQDLRGEPVARAPRWTGNIGASYETPIASGLRLGLSSELRLSSGYFTATPNNPGGRQPAFETVDASIRLMDDAETWELALIGSNLTNEYHFERSYTATFGGGGTGTTIGAPTDSYAFVNRGRQVLARLTYNFK